MSSHREAPEISKDPVADSTDIYAFVSPDKPGSVTLIANYIPLEAPAGGPNFYEFGDDVLYEIHIDNNGDGQADISYQFRFNTTVRNPDTFLYNTGPIESLGSPNWNRVQTYSVSGPSGTLGSGLACPPCNVGPLSTPDYAGLAAAAVHDLGGGISVFAGQRAEAFFVDLGAIFDLADLRPFANLHATFGLPGIPKGPGVNATNHVNVHSIAIQVPKGDLTRSGKSPSDPTSSDSVIGVWGAASRKAAVIRERGGNTSCFGNWVQVSRLGNPLINEVVIPMGSKDLWNSLMPADDAQFLADARRAQSLGYQGKMCIHPRQVGLAHQVFTPTPEEVAHARAVVAAGEAGVAVVDGQMVDDVHVRMARAVLARAPGTPGPVGPP